MISKNTIRNKFKFKLACYTALSKRCETLSKECGYSLKISATVGVFDIHDLRLVYIFSIADLIEGMFSEVGLS